MTFIHNLFIYYGQDKLIEYPGNLSQGCILWSNHVALDVVLHIGSLTNVTYAIVSFVHSIIPNDSTCEFGIVTFSIHSPLVTGPEKNSSIKIMFKQKKIKK